MYWKKIPADMKCQTCFVKLAVETGNKEISVSVADSVRVLSHLLSHQCFQSAISLNFCQGWVTFKHANAATIDTTSQHI